MQKTYAIFIITTTALLSACGESGNNAAESLQNDVLDIIVIADNPASGEDAAQTGANELQGNSTPAPGEASLDLRNDYDDILTSLAGYDLELIGEQIALLADNATVSALSSDSLPSHIVELDVQGTVQPYAVTSTQYSCALGGTLVVDTLDVDDFVVDSSVHSNTLTYQFDQCQLNSDQTQVLNGVMAIGTRDDSGRRYNTSESTYQWQNFSWQQADGTLVQITAELSIYLVSSYDNNDRRRVFINEHTSTDVDGNITGVRDSLFTLTDVSLGNGAVYEYSLQVEGQIINSSDIAINVTTDPALYRKRVTPSFTGEQNIPFTGQINLSASDGSSLNLIAVDPGNSGSRLVDVVYTTREGNVSTLQAQQLTELEVYAP